MNDINISVVNTGNSPKTSHVPGSENEETKDKKYLRHSCRKEITKQEIPLDKAIIQKKISLMIDPYLEYLNSPKNFIPSILTPP